MKHIILFENFTRLLELEEPITDSEGRAEVVEKPEVPNEVESTSKAVNWTRGKILDNLGIPIIIGKYELYNSKKKGEFPEIKVIMLGENNKVVQGGVIPEKFDKADLKWLSIDGISYIKGEHKNTKKIGFYPNYIQLKALKAVEIKKGKGEEYLIKPFYHWYNIKVTPTYRLSPDPENYESDGRIKNVAKVEEAITQSLKGKDAGEVAKSIFGKNLSVVDTKVAFLPEEVREKMSKIISEKSSPSASS